MPGSTVSWPGRPPPRATSRERVTARTVACISTIGALQGPGLLAAFAAPSRPCPDAADWGGQFGW